MAQKAPGKSFRKGITLIELFQMFPDEFTAREWFEGIRWPDGERYCPCCGSIDVFPVPNEKPSPYRCKDCRKYFSVKTGAVMHRSKIPLQKWAIAIYLSMSSLKGVSSMKLHRDLGITQKSAWYMGHRIREAFGSEGMPLFQGPVEVDETYFGGVKGNKPKSKRSNQGRGPKGKSVVVGATDRATNKVSAEVVDDVTGETLQGFVKDRAIQGSQVFTADHKNYRGLADAPSDTDPRFSFGYFEHTYVKHSVGEYVDGMAHANGIESFWAMLKRGYHGVYHKMSKKHLQRYVNEFAGHHNLRPMETIYQMQTLAHGMIGKQLSYKELIK